ncbi:MAG TPA: amidohydrolase family protein [Polyangia bacterium]|nr:amidohydrolase family protein [Polyangia bacterium]
MIRRRDVLIGGAGAAVDLALARPAAAAAAVAVDVHCHTFCSSDLPIVGFVAHHIPGLVELSRFVTHWPETVVRALVWAAASLPNAAGPTGAEELAWLRAQLPPPARGLIGPVAPLPAVALDTVLGELAKRLPFSVSVEQRRILERYVSVLFLVGHGRAAIAASAATLFPSIELFTPALVDYDAWSEDQAPTPLWQQIRIQEAIARLSTAGRIGRPEARFHPFVAFDPRRQIEGPQASAKASGATALPTADSSALEMVRYAIEVGGFLGVKVYPPVGFAPYENARLQPRLSFAAGLDAALDALYSYCEAAEVPILTHAGASNEYALGLRELVAPGRWAPVLARHPALRLNFGHFGHDYGVSSDGSRAGWIYQAAVLIDRYPNVHADLSNSPLVYDPAYARRLRDLLADVMARFPKVRRRLMYGSDWWLSALDPDALAAVERFRATLGDLLGPEGTVDLMGRNALRFLGLLDDQNHPRSGQAAARLRAFYGRAPAPAWLPGV